MGKRKKLMADAMKEARKTQYFASLKNVPTSPRKMRLVADMVRGMEVDKALYALKLHPKEASGRIEKLLLSALSNFEQKSNGTVDASTLFVKEISVDGGRALKRLQTAPQGRAHRIRKRSNHVTLVLDSKN
ncbi:MAG: 50S ribosomal protein L22 [Flavobacteriales bacterium]|nr:50S ribosomal protein L22 [Flavobacteriales bacterium]